MLVGRTDGRSFGREEWNMLYFNNIRIVNFISKQLQQLAWIGGVIKAIVCMHLIAQADRCREQGVSRFDDVKRFGVQYDWRLSLEAQNLQLG